MGQNPYQSNRHKPQQSIKKKRANKIIISVLLICLIGILLLAFIPPTSLEIFCSIGCEMVQQTMNQIHQKAKLKPQASDHIEQHQQEPLHQHQNKLHKAFFQLAGHKECFRTGTRPDTILKRSTGNEEACFKELMNDDKLSSFVPKIFRTIDQDGQYYLEMQDLLANFVNPSVMDIKMGCRTYREDELDSALRDAKLRHDMYDKMIEVDLNEPTNEERKVKAITKPRYMIWRETVSSTASLGFRIEGMRLWDGTVDKDFKTIKDEEQIIKAFLRYAKSSKIRLKYLNRLYDLKHALTQSNFFWTHELIGSSLLFVHDEDDAKIWLIDFAKTDLIPEHKKITHKSKWEIGNHEDGYLVGVENLIRLLEALNSCTNGIQQQFSVQKSDDITVKQQHQTPLATRVKLNSSSVSLQETKRFPPGLRT